jgi:copper transport protein
MRSTLIGVVALLLALLPGLAAAHAELDTSDPAPNAIVPTAPAAVRMTFTEPLERSYSKAELYDQHGNQVEGTKIEPGGGDTEMTLSLPADLPNGTYTVLWRSMSTDDGHTAQNFFVFTVGSAADISAAAGPVATTSGPPLWLRAAARWAALIGLAAAMAAWPVWLLVIRPALTWQWRHARRATRLMRRFAFAAIGLAIGGDLFAIAVQAASLTDGSLIERIRATLGDTRYGEWWYVRVGILLALLIALQWVAWWWPRRRPAVATVALALSLAAPIPFSYVAHAAAAREGRPAALLADILHVVLASLWVGGLLAVVAVLVPLAQGMAPPARRRVLSEALPRFSTIALIAWAALGLTGLYSAWLQVGSVDALLHTGYGKALMTKLLLLIPILALAAFNLLVVTNRLRRHAGMPDRAGTWMARFRYAVVAEALLAVAVLAAVGALTAQSPAREAIASAPAGMHADLTGGARDARLTVSPGAPGPNLFTVTVSGAPMLHETQVLLRVKSTTQKTGEKDLQLVHGGDTVYSYRGSELSLPGTWDLQLIVRQPDAPEWRAFGSIDIAATPARSSQQPSWVLGAVPGVIGMLLALAGIACMMVAWQRPGLARRGSVWSGGAVLLLVAAIILLLARTEVTASVGQAIAMLG